MNLVANGVVDGSRTYFAGAGGGAHASTHFAS